MKYIRITRTTTTTKITKPYFKVIGYGSSKVTKPYSQNLRIGYGFTINQLELLEKHWWVFHHLHSQTLIHHSKKVIHTRAERERERELLNNCFSLFSHFIKIDRCMRYIYSMSNHSFPFVYYITQKKKKSLYIHYVNLPYYFMYL